ncbi:ataxin-1 [Sabethes cyaneus]|uniref:ataxin-1 n=1 Tax=Sabethes cyaneus TaxID=53552 RepID=UPI00237DC17D|nr:ataxin-1 [Sabethes cyaneus]
MLSAVENLGSGRVYPHPFPSTGSPSLLGQLPLSATGLPLLGPNLVDMSVAEFARPHPKQQRYNEAPRNGLLSSTRTKYSDTPQSPQGGPVNLAVSPNLPNSHSSQAMSAAKLNQFSHEFHERALQARAHAQQQQLQHQQQQQQRHQEQQKEAAAVSVADIGKLYSPTNSRLPFFSTPLDTSSFPSLNYGLYPFGYSATHLDARMLGRPTYLTGQRDAYTSSSFLAPSTFSSSENKAKMYPSSTSLSHLNSQNGSKPTSLSQIPQDKMLSDERCPKMPPSPLSSALIGTYTDRERSHLNGLTGAPEHPLHNKYLGTHPTHSEKDNKQDHKQLHQHSSHLQQLQQHQTPSGSIVAGSLSQGHHSYPSLPPSSAPFVPTSSSTSISSSNQRHHSMPHASSLTSHPHGNHPHQLSLDGQRLEQIPSDNEFKVPSGKEGSLKHRILTRPVSDREARRRSPITKSTTIFRPFENGSTTNFTKGALIQLAGECKRVEDVRTEDLVQTAEKSSDLRLAESTAVRITPRNNNVIITFSYDDNRSRIDIEAAIEHPFFVYGQGWASCSPEKSLQQFGLKCQRLQVGDICLSLISRDKPKSSHSSSSSSCMSYMTLTQPHVSHYQSSIQQLHQHDINGNHQTALHHQSPYPISHQVHPLENLRLARERVDLNTGQPEKQKHQQYLPQNLSRKALPPSMPSSGTVTLATSTSSRSSGVPPYSSLPSVPVFSTPFSAANLSQPYEHKHFLPKSSSDSQALNSRSPANNSHSFRDSNDQPVAMIIDRSSIPTSSSTTPYTSVNSLISSTSISSSVLSPNRVVTSSTSLPPTNLANDNDDDGVIDASLSRKRRWSAPDMCEEIEGTTHEQQLVQSGTSQENSAQVSSAKIPHGN